MKSYEDAIKVVKEFYYRCPNIEDHKCYTWWRHEQCAVLMAILFVLTKDPVYDLDESAGDWWSRFFDDFQG